MSLHINSNGRDETLLLLERDSAVTNVADSKLDIESLCIPLFISTTLTDEQSLLSEDKLWLLNTL